VIDKLEDRFGFWSKCRAPKISRNLRLIWNSGFFVRGCRIRKPNFSRDATPSTGRR
jgi:hypothetical protein